MEETEYPDYPNYIVFNVNDPAMGKIILNSDNTDARGRFFSYGNNNGWTTFSAVTAVPAAGYELDHWEYNGVLRGFADGHGGYSYFNPPSVERFWPESDTRGTDVQVVTAVFKKSNNI